MLANIWMAITFGQGVIRTLAAFKKDVESFRSGNARTRAQYVQMEVLEKRTSDLEFLAREQDERLQKIENSLQDALTATEAVAQRAGTIFWMALGGCAFSVPALVLALLLLILRR